jgi:uncharacterized membrane protein YgdD (TMEM256/DUF423 family)
MEDRRGGGFWLGMAGLNGAVGVIAGAMAAHGASAPELVETASRYQLLHAVALFGVALLMRSRGGRFAALAGWAFLAGCLFFSGGLYGRAFIASWSLGWVAPLGGTAFILGWLLLAAAGFRDWIRFRGDPR